MRWIYGVTGALAGIAFGFFTVWLIVITIRSLGAVANAAVTNEVAGQRTPATRFAYRNEANGASPLVDSLAKLKNSIELGSLGSVVKGADIVPATTYDTLGKVGQVFSNPSSAERFLSYPGAKELTENPRIVALRDDPQIMNMIEQGRISICCRTRADRGCERSPARGAGAHVPVSESARLRHGPALTAVAQSRRTPFISTPRFDFASRRPNGSLRPEAALHNERLNLFSLSRTKRFPSRRILSGTLSACVALLFVTSALAQSPGVVASPAKPLDNEAASIEVHFSPGCQCTAAIVGEINAARETIHLQAYSFTSRRSRRRW